MLDHEKLDVYQLAIEFIACADELVEALPRGRGYLGDQLHRASLSVVLNIAEGAGKTKSVDKGAFYARARGSATECSAVLDVCEKLRLLDKDLLAGNKAMLERIVQMLTKLIRSQRVAP